MYALTKLQSLALRPGFLGGLGVAIALSGSTAWAQGITEEEALLIDQGFTIFTAETFDGNGRTCATCHIPSENYNIFPSTIENLSKKEQNLVTAKKVPGLENIDLVLSRALFNISGNGETHGADEPEFFGTAGHEGPIFRSSMGLFGLALTSRNTDSGFPGTPLLPAACSAGVEDQLPQLGWSGDGSPGTPVDNVACRTHHGIEDPAADGGFRAFATGAVFQHNPKSVDRILGTDFRFPTDDELDALEALQLWLGRRPLTPDEDFAQGTPGAGSTEFDIDNLNFADPRINLGRDHFAAPAEIGAGADPTVVGGGCNGCHNNAGALSPIAGGGFVNNLNINTDVELGSDDIGFEVVGFALPHDEGASNLFGPPNPKPPTFDEAFNIQSIIEAAQKRAWFHNHRVRDDFEEAIAFYGSADFAEGPVFSTLPVLQNGNGTTISFPNGDGIEHIGAFLRALNAFYNLRDCERLVNEIIDRIGLNVATQVPANHCRFSLQSAARVLKGIKLSPQPYEGVVGDLKGLHNAIKKASNKKNIGALEDLADELAAIRADIAAIGP